VTDTLTDRIEAHLAKARAAVPARQHEKRGWWCCGINGGFAVSAPEGDHMTTIARGGSEPVGRHIAANDPATILAFCAVAKAAEEHLEYCDGSGYPIPDALAALYDALGKE
jgi:Fe-S oxidoreductase